MARTISHYNEFGNKTSKLLAWVIEMEENDRITHSVVTDEGRSLFIPQDINQELKTFHETLYRSEESVENTQAKYFLKYFLNIIF